MTSIELLAPAHDLKTALEAISHGADAIYIGAVRFGARAAAGNTVDDIRQLCHQAHVFRVKVYVTLNTILLDDELETARQLAWQLYEAGADALIVQDMAFLEMDMPPLPLHASTQMNNRTPEQVRWLRDLGFGQVVLARELSLQDMAEIHRAVPDIRLEVFVHGSICVSYNGQCYASQYCFSRSANRGECAQFCRLPFDLEDAEGRVLERQRHLLSLRDMNRSASLEQLLDAGAVSLKIEGRLKDVAYVKNVVAFYRQRLDEIFLRRPADYCRSSLGRHTFSFEPRLKAVFNRGFTDYFLRGRGTGLANLLSPKSTGEPIGVLKSLAERYLMVDSEVEIANGDGLCFYDGEGFLRGFRVNRVEGDRLYPFEMPLGLRVGTPLNRNFNHRFEALLARPSAKRKIPLRWTLARTPNGFSLTATIVGGIQYEKSFRYSAEEAHSEQRQQIERQLSRLGTTPFVCESVELRSVGNPFIPVSVLSQWRNEVITGLTELCSARTVRERIGEKSAISTPYQGQVITYLGNVANRLAEKFYLRHGAVRVEKAMEVAHSAVGAEPLLMQSRYCILFETGRCLKSSSATLAQPLYLKLTDGRKFRLGFDCLKCEMQVYAV